MGNDVVEIDIKGLIGELWNNRGTILWSTILVAAIFLSCSIFFVTPLYEGKAEMYVLSKSTSSTSLTDLQIGTSLSDDYSVIVNSRSVLCKVIDNLGLDMEYKELAKRTKTTMLSDRIIEIAVRDPDPDMAANLVEELALVAASYISQNMNQDPPSIIEHGYTDREKVAPSLSQNTMIGALIGFLIAALLVAISVMLNDSVMNNDDVVNKLGINVLGTLPLEVSEYDGGRIRKTPKELLKDIFVDSSITMTGSSAILKKKRNARRLDDRSSSLKKRQ